MQFQTLSVHTCEGQHEKALIAHPWEQEEDGWFRDDCVESGHARAATVCLTTDGTQWCGPESGPYGDGPFYDSAEEAMLSYDIHLVRQGWTLVNAYT